MRPIIRTASLALCAVLIAGCSATTSSAGPSSSSAPSSGSSVAPSSPIPSESPHPSSPGLAEPGFVSATSVGYRVECDQQEIRCDIHRTDEAGREAAGWPVTVDGPCRELRTGSDGLAYVGCSPRAGATIHVLDTRGKPVDGWPVRVPGAISSVAWSDFSIGCGVRRSPIEAGSDGSIYVAASSGNVANLHVFNPDGQPRAGWPQPIPGDAPGEDGHGGDGCRGFALADDDGVVAWGYQDVEMGIELSAGRTEFTSWSADGQVRPGWPRGSTGAASGPVLDSDGGITYVSASGRVWSHDEAGEIRRGWPYVLDHPAPPHVARDGRVAVFQKVTQAADRLVLLGRDDRLVTGRPIELPSDIESRCLFGDTPCAGAVFPAFATDGTIYLSLASSIAEQFPITEIGGSLIAFDADGDKVDGWPVELPQWTHVFDLSVDVEDRLVARGYVCSQGDCGSEGAVRTTMIFAPAGELLDQRLGD